MQFHPKLAMAIHAGFYFIQNLSTFIILIYTNNFKRNASKSIFHIYFLELIICNLEVFAVFQFALLKENSIQYVRAIHLTACFCVYQILLFTKILSNLLYNNIRPYWILFIFPSFCHLLELFFAYRFKKIMILIFSKRYKEILLNPRVLNATIYRERLLEVRNIALLLSLVLLHRFFNKVFLSSSPIEFSYFKDNDIKIMEINFYCSLITSIIIIFNIIILIFIALMLGIGLDEELLVQRICVMIVMALGFLSLMLMVVSKSLHFHFFGGNILYAYIAVYYVYGTIIVWRDMRNFNSGLKEVLENLKKNKSMSKKI